MFQYISDIHLEYKSSIPYIKKIADNLFLIGDIGHPGTFLFDKFLKKCSETYKNVFLVYGNHEYYSVLRGKHKKIETMQQKLNYAKDFPQNVYFLNNSCVYFNIHNQIVKTHLDTLDDKNNYVKIIGSTLWSDRGADSNNFKNIFMEEGQFLTFEHQSKLFYESKYYLINELYKEHIQSIILTHYTTNVCTNGNAYLDTKDLNHIRELFICKNLIACINGHTHASVDTVAPGTNIKLLANCFGYKNEPQEIVKYNPNAILDLMQTPLSLSGLYSHLEINPVDILYKVMHRPNPLYNIGQVDESTPYSISTMSKDASIIYVNRSFEKLTGYSLSEIKGKNCRFLQCPTGDVKRGSIRNECDNQLLFNVKTCISKKQECQFITYNFTKNKEKFINLITIIPVDINGIFYYVGFQCDISTEIHKFKLDNLDKSIIDCNVLKDLTTDYSNTFNEESTETASISFSVSRSESHSLFSGDEGPTEVIRYKHFFDENPGFLCIIDRMGSFKKINSTFLQALGYTKKDMYNKNLLDFVYRDDISHTIQHIDKLLEDNPVHPIKEVKFTNRYIKSDESLITINWCLKLKGRVIYSTGTKLTLIL